MSNLVATTSTARTISIAWEVTAAIFIERFEVSYSYTVNNCTASPKSDTCNVTNSMTSHTLSGLNEDSEYTITVRAINSEGSTNDTIMINTTTTSE